MGKERLNGNEAAVTELISQLIEEVKYGNITLIIQDGKIIQIDKTEKIRL
ncbi:MAG: YezD family protein [Lachnospiraceae bacterium]|nr:YezD family protein [Lachnospiraceae bacterium]